MADLKPPLNNVWALWWMMEPSAHEKFQHMIDWSARETGLPGFEAHLTLIGLPNTGAEQQSRLRTAAEAIAQRCSPFEFEVTGPGMLNEYLKALFFEVAPHPTATRANAIARLMFEQQASPPYGPHISIVYGDLASKTKRQLATELWPRITSPEKVPIIEIALVDANGYPDEWKIVARYPLGA